MGDIVDSDKDVKFKEWHEFFEQAEKVKAKTAAPAAYKEMMEDKIADGYEYLPISEWESCHDYAASDLAHLHPKSVCEYGDWRLYRIEELPPEMEYFERKSGTRIPRDECIVIVCRDGGERHVYQRKTALHPIVFDCDAYCDKRRLGDDELGQLPDIPIEKIDWNTRDEMIEDLDFEIDKLSVIYTKKAEFRWEYVVNEKLETALKLIDDTPTPLPIAPSPYAYRPPAFIPTREWLYGTKLIRKYLTLTVAPSGLGKSSKSLVEAVAMATGLDLLGIGWKPKKPLRVWYWCGEDPREEIERRIAGILLYYQINPVLLGDRLFIDSGRQKRINIAWEERGSLKIAVPHCTEIRDALFRDQIDVMIVDPFVSSHRVSENDNTKIDAIAKMWNQIAETGDCAIELVHHVRKAAYGSQEFTVEDGRGASSLLAASRIAEVLNPMSKDEAAKFGILESQRRAFFRCDNGKSSMSPPPERANWFKFESQDLDNGNDVRKSDSVGVVTAWTPPKPLDDVTGAHVDEIRKRCGAGNYRDDCRSPEWVGYMLADVLKLDGQSPTTKKKVKVLLALWIGKGALQTVERKVDGRFKWFVVPGERHNAMDKPFGSPVVSPGSD